MPSLNTYSVQFNGDTVPLTIGMLVRISAARNFVRVKADALANIAGFYGVVISGSAGPRGPVNAVSSSAAQRVLLETGLTPVAGQTLYASATTAGRATNVAPPIALPIGAVVDATAYTRDSSVLATVAVGSVSSGVGLSFRAGPALPDSDFTINPAVDAASVYTVILLSANRVLTIQTSGTPATNTIVYIARLDLGSFSYTLKNNAGTTLAVFGGTPATPQAVAIYFDGSDWQYLNFLYIV